MATEREVPHADITKKIIEYLKEATAEEAFQTFVKSGILTPDGRIHPNYQAMAAEPVAIAGPGEVKDFTMAEWKYGEEMKAEILEPWNSKTGDPIFRCSDGWYFWDETWTRCLGPFGSKEECRAKLAGYVDWLMNGP